MGRILKYALGVATALLLVGASGVRADTLDQFTYQAGGNTFEWQLPASPTALDFVIDGFGFGVLTGFTENGTAALGEINFFNGDPFVGGGLQVVDSLGNVLVDAFGPQVYSGPEGAPTFLPGIYSQLDFADPAQPDGILATLTVTEVAPVPEPSSVVLLGSGLLLMGLGFAVKKAAT